MTSERASEWWKEAVVYQIYPRSFNDADGDGVGDLPGIHEKLDYLDDLGVDAVWLTPVYDSPLADYGYDIRDYRQILDEYGTMADWERVRDGLHERGMRLLMDLVVNHTSDEHEWFEQSRHEIDPYTDYYIWREGDGVPNNWESMFGGPAWTYDEVREAHYLHLFDSKQPDLNWGNPRVREEVYELMRWWLDREVDGFRMDVINLISKPEGLPDGRPSAVVTGSEHFINGPRLGEFLDEMDDRVLSAYDVMTIGEMPGASVQDARAYAGRDGPLDMVFHFEHMRLDSDESEDDPWDFGNWELADLKETFTRWQVGLSPESWNALYLNNHDQPRQVSRFGDDDQYREESAKLLGTLLHTLRGTPFVYQGEEIGMTNVHFEEVDELEDVETIRYVERMLERDDVENFADIQDAVVYGSRDNARTPVQWADEPNAGFTTGEPWLKVNPNYPEVNVADALARPDSVWQYYRQLIDLRNEYPVLVYGTYTLLAPDHPQVYAYLRETGDGDIRAENGDRALVVLNVSDERVEFRPADHVEGEGELLLANYDVPQSATLDDTSYQPYEARVYLLE